MRHLPDTRKATIPIRNYDERRSTKNETRKKTRQSPAGYNKLTAPVTVEAVKTGSTSTHTTVYLDKDGNIANTETDRKTEVKVDIEKIAAKPVVVVNKAGTELPSTGGMGTTVFYVLGAVLVLGAVVLLVTKKRMNDANR